MPTRTPQRSAASAGTTAVPGRRAGLLFVGLAMTLAGVLSVGRLAREALLGHALLVAVRDGDAGRARRLLDSGASADYAEYPRRTALDLAARLDNVEILRVMLDRRAAQTGDASCPPILLAGASMAGHPANIRVLLQRGADVNARYGGGRTALMVAAEGGHCQALRELIRSGADIEAADDAGQTALTQAVAFDQRPAVSELLAHGASPWVRTRGGLSLLDIAASTQDPRMLQLLRQAMVRH